VAEITDSEIQAELHRLHRDLDRVNSQIANLQGDVLESSMVPCEKCGLDPAYCNGHNSTDQETT
jgi:hypothetical protein